MFGRIREDKSALYIYGAGRVAKHLRKILHEKGIEIQGFVVDEEYISKLKIQGECVISIGELKKIKKVSVIMAMQHMECGRRFNKWNNVAHIYYPAYIHTEANEKPERYIEEHRNDYDKYIDGLHDELSQQIMRAYLHSVITRDGEQLLAYCNQQDSYFHTSFWEVSRNSVFIDAGAFTGDTVREYVGSVKGEYDSIYAFEADEDRFMELKVNLHNWGIEDNVNMYNVFLSNFSEKIKVQNMTNKTGNVGYILNGANGDTLLNAARLDDVVIAKGKEVFLKCNTSRDGIIEIICSGVGMIARNKVSVAIKIGYIKQEEIARIFQYFISKAEYKLYVRLIGGRADDLVLYAIND